jgi:plastocyanin
MLRLFSKGALLFILTAFVVAGCGDDNKSTNPPPPGGGNNVTIADFSFSPSTLTISVGDTVTWTNSGPSAHTTTSDTQLWDSGLLNANQSFSRPFPTAGSFPYHCTPHSNMTGTIIVQ